MEIVGKVLVDVIRLAGLEHHADLIGIASAPSPPRFLAVAMLLLGLIHDVGTSSTGRSGDIGASSTPPNRRRTGRREWVAGVVLLAVEAADPVKVAATTTATSGEPPPRSSVAPYGAGHEIAARLKFADRHRGRRPRAGRSHQPPSGIGPSTTLAPMSPSAPESRRSFAAGWKMTIRRGPVAGLGFLTPGGLRAVGKWPPSPAIR